ncbi:flagellar biosynthesis protein FlgG [Campylobacter sp. VTCC 70190]|uniref:flagellar biosynthesis protein FlgG n=1 Tax=Campylobacter sp. VTCC 70190 TaxID=3392118 RepID=UPI00398F726D
MIYILAFFFPYVALLVRGLWIQAIFNFILCVIGYFMIMSFFGAFFVLLLRFGVL